MFHSFSTRFACAALAFCLFLSGAEWLNAQNSRARQHAARAAQFVQAGDLKGAEAEMRQAVELSPKRIEYLMRLGLILEMQQRPKVAVIFFERALKLDPANLIVRRHLAGSQWQSGRLDASQENLEAILKVNPGDSEALLMLGMVSMDAGRFLAAHEVAQKAAKAMPSSDQAHALKGMAEMRMQRYTEAAKSYGQAVKLNPKALEANLGLAMSLWAQGSIAESFAIFEQGLKRFPEDAYHYLEYGRLLLKSAKPDDAPAETRAVALLQNALRVNGNSWVGFQLVDTKSNRDAIGAKLTLRLGDRKLVRWITGGASIFSSHDYRVVFGLGANPGPSATSVEIRWPSGVVQTVDGLPSRQYHKVVEPADKAP